MTSAPPPDGSPAPDRLDPPRGSGDDLSRSLDVPCEVLSVTIVRQRLAAHLLSHGAHEQLVRDAATVVSELLMNAIVHGAPDASGAVHVSWTITGPEASEGRGDGLDVVVADHGAEGLPHVEMPDDDDAGGRGLQLVQLLCARWSATREDDRTVVRARLVVDRLASA